MKKRRNEIEEKEGKKKENRRRNRRKRIRSRYDNLFESYYSVALFSGSWPR